MADRIRVRRIIDYVGDEEWVRTTLQNSFIGPGDGGAFYCASGSISQCGTYEIVGVDAPFRVEWRPPKKEGKLNG